MGPMELLRLIRLEQVNCVLRSNELRKSLELNKVGMSPITMDSQVEDTFQLLIKANMAKPLDKPYPRPSVNLEPSLVRHPQQLDRPRTQQ